jgi:hypothetical protein
MTGRAALVAIAVLTVALASACTGAGPTAANGSDAIVTHLTYRYMTDLGNGAVDRDYGYNLVDLGPYRATIDALPAGERALVWIGNYSLARCAFDMSDASVRHALSTLAGDPKVAGYYLADEADDALPAYGGHCPHVVTQITQRSRLVHQLAPGTFTYEVVTEPGNFAAFAHATDVMGADPYPCLRGRPCDWAEIPAYIAALNAAHVPRYWGLLQAFSYGKWRAPTAAELARMIGQWEQSRWQGEQTFSWNYLGWSLASHPGLLVVLKSLNAGNTATAADTASNAAVKTAFGTRDPGKGISVLVQVCTVAVEDSCDPDNAADWASSATVYTTTIRWRVVITNTGTGPLTNIYVTSSLAPKQNDCAGPVTASPLNAGRVMLYECETDHVTAPATITQTVTASGNPSAGPFITPASSAATAQVASAAQPPRAPISVLLQVCILAKQASCDPDNAADWASSGTLHRPMARWRVVITNTGKVALSDIYTTDTLAQTDCGGSVTSSLAAGALTEYECQTSNVTRTTTNKVTATGDLPSGAPVTSAASSSTALVNGILRKGATPDAGSLANALPINSYLSVNDRVPCSPHEDVRNGVGRAHSDASAGFAVAPAGFCPVGATTGRTGGAGRNAGRSGVGGHDGQHRHQRAGVHDCPGMLLGGR